MAETGTARFCGGTRPPTQTFGGTHTAGDALGTVCGLLRRNTALSHGARSWQGLAPPASVEGPGVGRSQPHRPPGVHTPQEMPWAPGAVCGLLRGNTAEPWCALMAETGTARFCGGTRPPTQTFGGTHTAGDALGTGCGLLRRNTTLSHGARLWQGLAPPASVEGPGVGRSQPHRPPGVHTPQEMPWAPGAVCGLLRGNTALSHGAHSWQGLAPPASVEGPGQPHRPSGVHTPQEMPWAPGVVCGLLRGNTVLSHGARSWQRLAPPASLEGPGAGRG
ncbi:hypothetical protein NDU88_008107 [Pleurodeles waltl]|uniref:Uncharacterized protein n=1 Tax=Pleurodeles waltl TaxID=8319 RepID=A0AAV7U2C2_PLEWA|nr:hypothetical protein NDU88_008107 [Pleurodeles waltl]